ncbi:MAG: hypothetical protein AAGA90_20180, partial [Actinomycetota bacterium]
MKHTILISAIVLLAAACSGGDEDVQAAPQIIVDGSTSNEADQDDQPDDGPAQTTGLTDEEIAIRFVECMRGEGVEMADPTVNADGSVNLGGGPGGGGGGGQGPGGGGGEGGGPPEGFQEAFEACGDLLDGASFLGGGGGFDEAEFEDQMLAFAQCLRDQGLDVDDPDLDSFGPGGGGGGGAGLFGEDFNPQDPDNQQAIQAC